MAEGDIGYRSCIFFKDDDGVWQMVFQATKITPWEGTTAKTPFKHLRSPDFAGENKPGAGEYSDASFDVLYVYNNPTHLQLLADRPVRKIRDWKIEYRNPETDAVQQTWACSAFIVSIKPGDITFDDARMLSVTLAYHSGPLGTETGMQIT